MIVPNGTDLIIARSFNEQRHFPMHMEVVGGGSKAIFILPSNRQTFPAPWFQLSQTMPAYNDPSLKSENRVRVLPEAESIGRTLN